MSSTVCVISESGEVLRYDGNGTSWHHIGGSAVEPAVQIISGDWGLIARKGWTGNTYHYYNGGNDWEDMGGPRGMASIGHDTVFAFPRDDVPDLPLGVYQFDGYDQNNGSPLWSKIGPAEQGCLAGKWGVVGYRGGVGVGNECYHYSGTPNVWDHIGSATGSHIMVVGQDTVYRVGLDWALEQYDGTGTSWTKISEPLVNHGVTMDYGLFGLVYSDHNTNGMYLYLGEPNAWQRIGPSRPWFAVTDDTVYAIPLDRSGVYRYDGDTWTRILRGRVKDNYIVATD